MTTPRPTVQELAHWLQRWGAKGPDTWARCAADILLNCGLPLDAPFYPETGEIKLPLLVLREGESFTADSDLAYVITPAHTHMDVLRYVVNDVGKDHAKQLLDGVQDDSPPIPTPASTAGAGEGLEP